MIEEQEFAESKGSSDGSTGGYTPRESAPAPSSADAGGFMTIPGVEDLSAFLTVYYIHFS